MDLNLPQWYLDVTQVILVAIDADAKVTLINRRGCELLGYSQSETVGRDWFATFVPARLRSEVLSAFRSLMVGAGTPVEFFENPVLTRSGQERLIAWHNTVLRDPDGRIVGTFSSGQDVTDLNRTTAELRESEGRYRRVVEVSPDPIIIHQQGRIVFANPATAKFLGVEDETPFIGRPVMDFVHPESREQAAERIREMLAQGSRVPLIEEKFVRQDGSVRSVEVAAVAISYHDQPAVLVAFHDITERKQAEAALHRSEEQYRLLFEAAPVGISTTDLSGRVLAANQHVLAMLGCTMEELKQRGSSGFYAREEARARLLAALYEKGALRNYEVELRRMDDSTFTALFDIERVELAGELVLFSAVRDISDRKAAEAALRQSEERFRVTFEQAAAGIARIAPDGHFMRMNRRFCEITGYSEQELLALTRSDITSPDDAKLEQENTVRLLAGEVNSYTMEKRYIRKDDSSVWANVTISLVRRESGEPDYLIAVAEDIGERRRAQIELQNLIVNMKSLNQLAVELAAAPPELDLYRFLGERLARITDAVMIAVSQYDPAEHALVVHYLKIPGRDLIAKASRLLGTDPAAFRTPVNDETYRLMLTTTVRDVGSLHESTFGAIPEPASRAIHSLLGMGRIFGVAIADKGELVGSAVIGRRKGAPELNHEVMLTFANMAAVSLRRRRAEEQVQTLNVELARRVTELETAVKELDAFSYSISHDLRSPLRAIDGFSRILIEDYQSGLPPAAREHLDRVRQSTQHMGKLIDDLLAFSRLSRQPLRLQPVQPAPLIRRVLDDLHEDQRGRNVKITIQDLPACRGDAALLQQVFHNLLANALKFTRPRDPAIIEIGTVPDAPTSTPNPQHPTPVSPQVTYFVRDNGVGFDDQYADRAFGVFQRLHRAEEYEGTGVGLAIVQRIIHQHEGQIWAKARVDQGATFYFTLPAAIEGKSA